MTEKQLAKNPGSSILKEGHKEMQPGTGVSFPFSAAFFYGINNRVQKFLLLVCRAV